MPSRGTLLCQDDATAPKRAMVGRRDSQQSKALEHGHSKHGTPSKEHFVRYFTSNSVSMPRS